MKTVGIGGTRLEYVRLPSAHPREGAPAIVFLHEGLGSVAMWRDFPQRVADATGCEAIVYSRAGYGRSGPATLPRTVRYMHDEGLTVLPALLAELGVERPLLFGHSDGGSIALICAGGTDVALSGLILMAPHVIVEDISVSPASPPPGRRGPRPTCRPGWGATTMTSRRPFAAGTTSGCTRISAPGTSSNTCRGSPFRCWRSRARMTSTARWRRSSASPRRRATWNCAASPIAAIRRTRTSRRRCSTPSPLLSSACSKTDYRMARTSCTPHMNGSTTALRVRLAPARRRR